MSRKYFVYIATNKTNRVLYTGITNNNVNKLIFIEEFNTPTEVIAAEKKIKGWTRAKKIALIKNLNPELRDLFY